MLRVLSKKILTPKIASGLISKEIARKNHNLLTKYNSSPLSAFSLRLNSTLSQEKHESSPDESEYIQSAKSEQGNFYRNVNISCVNEEDMQNIDAIIDKYQLALKNSQNNIPFRVFYNRLGYIIRHSRDSKHFVTISSKENDNPETPILPKNSKFLHSSLAKKAAANTETFVCTKYESKSSHHIGYPFIKTSDPPLLRDDLRKIIEENDPTFHIDLFDEESDLKLHAKRKIYQPEMIDWNKIPPFVVSSRDPAMITLSKILDPSFTSSTSSFTGLLSLLELCLTKTILTHAHKVGSWASKATRRFSYSAMKPTSFILRRRDTNLWGCDTYPTGDPKANEILIDLGKSLELQLTTSPEQFKHTYLSDEALESLGLERNSEQISNVEFDSYSYLSFGKLLLRSQLDCMQITKDGKKLVFDLKTRATVPIRYNVRDYLKYLDYKIISQKGIILSVEREKYDMIRTAFMKYFLQCMIGNMDGVYVAYHNTDEIFASEFISIEDMSEFLFGHKFLGSHLFHHSLKLANYILNRIVADHGQDQDVKCIRTTIGLNLHDTSSNKVNSLLLAVDVPKFDANLDPEEHLRDRHYGPMYIDTMTPDQIRKALELRRIPFTGVESQDKALLEAIVAPPSGNFRVSQSYIQDIVKGNVTMYHLDATLTNSGKVVKLTDPNLEESTLEGAYIRGTLLRLKTDKWVETLYSKMLHYHNMSERDTVLLLPTKTDRVTEDHIQNIRNVHKQYNTAIIEAINHLITYAESQIESSNELDLETVQKVEKFITLQKAFIEELQKPLEIESAFETTSLLTYYGKKYFNSLDIILERKAQFESETGLTLPSYLRPENRFSDSVLKAGKEATDSIKKLIIQSLEDGNEINIDKINSKANM